MTNTLLAEERLSLTTLASELGVSPKTVSRWVEGFRGCRLEHYRLGKRRYSSRQAAARFVAALNDELIVAGEAAAVV